MTDAVRWPVLPLAEWHGTRDTLQLWLRIIGKVRLANTPLINHWCNVPFYVTTRGITTSLMRTAPMPGETLMTFLRSTYEAAATTANWDRKQLERWQRITQGEGVARAE